MVINSNKRRLIIFIFITITLPICSGSYTPQEFKTLSSNNTIVFGQSACLDGEFGLYGNIISKAIQARFFRINDHGGIKGKKIKLVSLNDGGNPYTTKKNIDFFLKNGIDMFIGNMGTRSILRLLPLVKGKKIAIFFPWSGDDQLRDPTLTNIINGPGLLLPQLKAIVNYIEKNIKIKKIGIFHADDDFSTAAASDLAKILSSHNIKPAAITPYNRFTLDIVSPATTLLNADPKIVISIATSMPTVKLINNFFIKGNYNTSFFGIDSTLFVGDIVQTRGVDFYYSSAVPNPTTNTLLLTKQYLFDLKKYFPEEIPNILSFSYYLSAAIITHAIENISGQIKKESIIAEIEKMEKTLIEEFSVSFDKTNRHIFGKNISIIKG